MTRRYIGYADLYKEKISSLVLAEFDSDKLSEGDKDILEEWEEGNEDLEEEMLDSLNPYFYHFALDYNDDKPIIFVKEADPENEVWPVNCNNVYMTLSKAKMAVCRDLNNNSIERGIIIRLLK